MNIPPHITGNFDESRELSVLRRKERDLADVLSKVAMGKFNYYHYVKRADPFGSFTADNLWLGLKRKQARLEGQVEFHRRRISTWRRYIAEYLRDRSVGR